MPDEPTLWELSRLITRVETGLREDIGEVRQQIAALKFVDQGVWEAEKRAIGERQTRNEERLKNLEERGRRAIVLAISAFVAPLAVALVLYLVVGSPG